MNLDFNEIWTHTPFFGKFLWAVLLFMSVCSLSVSIGKWWNLRKAQKETIKFAPEFSQFLEEDNLAEAIKLAEGYKKSHVARVLGGALSEVKPLIMDGSVTVSDINTAERAVEREMLMELVTLKRGLSVLATVGATAPFVGLLGTVFGIINAFVGMATSGGAGIAAISAGIAEALIATGFGLIVAIPAEWFYNYFTTKIDNLTAEMTYTSKEMIDYLIKGVSGEFGRSRFTREFNAQVSSGGPVTQQSTGFLRGGPLMNVGTGASSVKSEPNVVPMIDVMLVLLIIFMVVLPALTSGFTANPPQGINLKSHPEEDTDQVLGIDKNGAYYINKRPIPLDSIGPILKEIYVKRDDYVRYGKADKELPYSKVLDAMDIASKNGVRVVGAVSDQMPGTKSTVEGDLLTDPAKKKP